MSNDNFKPCPKCGSRYVDYPRDGEGYKIGSWILCDDCGYQEDVETWNTRYEEPKQEVGSATNHLRGSK